MNISKEDAVAQLAKWHDAATHVRAVYSNITGNLSIVGEISGLSPASIKIAGIGSEMTFYFRSTSRFEYRDARQVASESTKARPNQYPTVIEIIFSNGDALEVREF